MRSTRATLLTRVRDLGDREAWGEFYDLYAPILFGYAKACGLDDTDAEDVRDQCFDVLIRTLPDFAYDRARGRFKSWLRAIARARVVDILRAKRAARLGTGEMLAIPDTAPDPARVWEEQWRAQLMRFALDRARHRVSSRRWRAFELLLFRNYSVEQVERELGMNSNQVYKAKSQVLREVRLILGRHDG